jgi:hypothetical protein
MVQPMLILTLLTGVWDGYGFALKLSAGQKGGHEQ